MNSFERILFLIEHMEDATLTTDFKKRMLAGYYKMGWITEEQFRDIEKRYL